MAVTLVELRGQNGFDVTLAGDGAGEDGVVLYANGFNGFSDSPISTEYKSGAFQVGGKLVKVSRPLRTVTLTLGLFAEDPTDLVEIENNLKEAIKPELDRWDPTAEPAHLDVTVDGTTWTLDLYLSETTATPLDVDPLDDLHMIVTVTAVAPNPDWYAPDVSTTWTCTGTSGSGTVAVSNPGPLPMDLTWYIVGRGTVTLPDRSWTGPPGARVPGTDFRTGRNDATRTLLLPSIGATNGDGAWVHTDRNLIPIEDFADTLDLVGRSAGNRLLYKIPPYTPVTSLPVSATAAVAGLTVTVQQPRRHTRPWGGSAL